MFNPVVLFPDTCAVVVGHLAGVLAVPVSRSIPNPRPSSFVTVLRTGGAVNLETGVTEAVQLTFEAWAETHLAAHDLAQLTRAHIHSLAGTVSAGVTVYRVEEAAGPQDLPDPVSEQPRWSFTVLAHVRGAAFDPFSS